MKTFANHANPGDEQVGSVTCVTVEEQQKIESELGIRGAGFVYSNRIAWAKCGGVYGAFEFIQQGIREHGREIVETALNLENAAVVRVNPSTVAVCQNCSEILGGVGHYYICRQYGCCIKVQ